MAEMREEEIRRVRGAEIAMIYQDPMAALNPSLTIGSQLMEVSKVHNGASREDARDRALTMLRHVRIPDPDHIMAAYPHQISGGQQQRVVIAMALLSNPSLLLLDEPTTALDVTVEAEIVELIARLSAQLGTALLYISHNLDLMRRVCDRVCVMYSGQIVEEGAVESIFANPKHPYTHGLLSCIPQLSMDKKRRPLLPVPGQLPLPYARPAGCYFGPRCRFSTEPTCTSKPIKMEGVAIPDGAPHAVRCVRWEHIDYGAVSGQERDVAKIGESVLEVQSMQKYYPVYDNSIAALMSGRRVRYVKANEAIDFTARRGETVAIVGESGCGKSTLANVILGLECCTNGEIRMNGTSIGKLPVDRRAPELLSSLQMVFQNPDDTLNPSYTIGSQIARVVRRFGVETEREKVRQHVLRLLDLVKLPRSFYDRRPRQLSGGQKQRVAIARAFAGNPAIVVADEPVSSLDVSVAAAVIELFMEIQRERGTTLILISHDLSLVHYISDQVVVMYLGQIMERGPTEQIFAPPFHPYTEALLSAATIAHPGSGRRALALQGDLPSVLNPPKGCPLASRCPRKLGAVCDSERPPFQLAGEDHVIACHIPLADLRQMAADSFAPAPAAADDGTR